MRCLEKPMAMTKPRHLWSQGSRIRTPSPHPPYLWLSYFGSWNGCFCGNVLSDHSLSWPLWLKYSCLFINCVYSEKSTNWLTRIDYQVISFNLLHLLCPLGKDCGKRIGLGSRRTKLKFLLYTVLCDLGNVI